MIEQEHFPRGTPVNGLVLGCTQTEKLHMAILNVEGDAVLGCEFQQFRSPHMAMAYLGALAGYGFAHEVMQDNAFLAFIKG